MPAQPDPQLSPGAQELDDDARELISDLTDLKVRRKKKRNFNERTRRLFSDVAGHTKLSRLEKGGIPPTLFVLIILFVLLIVYLAALGVPGRDDRATTATNPSVTQPSVTQPDDAAPVVSANPGESTATLDASVCDTADEVAVEAWQFTEGEVFYGVGEDYDYWFLCVYGDGVAGRIKPIWAEAIGNTYVITGQNYYFESNWPMMLGPSGTERRLVTNVFEMTRTGDVLEGVVVWIGWQDRQVYDDEGSATPEWVVIELEPETETVRALLLPPRS